MSARRGLLDGAWWPRSRDLEQELSALADVLDPLWGRITRIAVNPLYWPSIPRKVPVNGRMVRVGWFAKELDPHKILLLSYTAGRWDLLVIPPETGAEAAARLMAAASEGVGHARTASTLMAGEQALHGGPVADQGQGAEEEAEEGWEGDGGASPSSRAAAVRSGHLVVGS
ncbi:DUF5994 family protein [Streptomyces sp. NPDC057298]|uniref:DUF5994 family protein n=1 Tax=Streptomyces sp. NPDC057298 TaxID=3346091 RepID=UPI00362BE31A